MNLNARFNGWLFAKEAIVNLWCSMLLFLPFVFDAMEVKESSERFG